MVEMMADAMVVRMVVKKEHVMVASLAVLSVVLMGVMLADVMAASMVVS